PLSALILVVVLPVTSFAQQAKIVGRVYDAETEDPLPGTNITLERVWQFGQAIELETKQGAACDDDGYFVILNVNPGIYDIQAAMMGYTSQIQTEFQANMDRTNTVDFYLAPTVLEMGAIEVTAKRDIIKADVAGTQEIILPERIGETPVFRVDEFVNKIKGVELVATEEGHGLSVRGGAIRETEVRIDGISARDPRSENAYLSLNSSSIQELQVLTGGFEAKYGGFRSGLVNVVTKAGTRDRYSLSLKTDFSPGGQQKFFGTNPWSDDSWVYRIFADSKDEGYAYTGISTAADSAAVPMDFWSFRGWNNPDEGNKNYQIIGLPDDADLTADEKMQLWKQQHPQFTFSDKPDMFIEAALTGPVPGGGIPVIGKFLGKSTFMLGGKYENTQFAFPLGNRSNYVDWNGQLKVSSHLTPTSSMTFNVLYAQVQTLTSNSPTNFGGALMDASSRFNFLSSTQASVQQQARQLANWTSMFNLSNVQYFDQTWLMGGVNYNKTLSPKAFFTLDFQFTYNDADINPFSADTSGGKGKVSISDFEVYNYPVIGAPNASTNTGRDLNDLFSIYGGVQQVDSSYSWTTNLKGDFTAQVGRHHEVGIGFSMKRTESFVYSGTWYQTEKMYTPEIPDAWQYYTVRPVEIGLYVQDKLEFQGMIGTLGLRADYFNPNKDYYLVGHPIDPDYANFYFLVYENLPGTWGSYERWKEYREMLDDPPGWPAVENKTQLKVSPRLGVSFPVTTNSKLYYNYGHFYQSPNMTFLYNMAVKYDAAIIPSPDLEMAKTIAYEFGYEQIFLQEYLFNVSLYYKDIRNEPLRRTFINYWQEYSLSKYFPDAYADILGIELRLEKSVGRFVSFWSNFDYMLRSRGQSGLRYVYENRVIAEDEGRLPNLTITEPIPTGHFNINVHTPEDWVTKSYGGINVNFLFDWRGGAEIVIQEDPVTGEQDRVKAVDYSNLDLRASKAFHLNGRKVELVLTVANLLNQKRLYTGAMGTADINRYRDSLHFPFEAGDQKGDDKWGEWDEDYIVLPWNSAPQFLTPRKVLLGLHMNL
ncbi:TonB-dependent receptor domain-containing protein, partial [Candidatus Neomarinimicrobiota bacterium]